MPEPEITALGVHIKVANIEKSRRFYESLGFKPVFGYGDERFRASLPAGVGSAPERYRGVTYAVGKDSSLEIAEGHIAVKKGVFKEVIKSPKISAMIKVKSLVPVIQNPLAKIKVPIRFYYWQTIEAAFRDPDGFVVVFIAPYSKEEFEAVSKLTKIETIKPGGTPKG
jgi:catechol 2,3-dioxygenase-like lactoylglutathione lyase family enzyme